MVRRLIHSLNSCSAHKTFAGAASPLAKGMRPKKGFTLLETLLSILLFSVGFVFILQIMSTGLFAGGQNENEIVALYLVQEKIEELKNDSFAAITAETKAAVTGFPAFSRQVDIYVPQTNLDQITVTVYWFARNTETSFTMVAYVSNT